MINMNCHFLERKIQVFKIEPINADKIISKNNETITYCY